MLKQEPELDEFVLFIIDYLNNLDPHDVKYYLLNDEFNNIKITTMEFGLIISKRAINVRGLFNIDNNFNYIAHKTVRKRPYKKLYAFAESHYNKQVVRIDNEYDNNRMKSVKKFIDVLCLTAK